MFLNVVSTPDPSPTELPPMKLSMTCRTPARSTLALLTILGIAASCDSAGGAAPRDVASPAMGLTALVPMESLAEAERTSLPAAQALPPSDADGKRAPDQIRGIYLTAYAAGSSDRLAELLDLASKTEINTFVIDVKTERGVHYRSEVPLARELTRPGQVAIGDLPQLLRRLKGEGIHTVARIVTFKDPLLVEARPEWAIQKPGGGGWVDREGNRWVSPWDDRVREYNLSIAEEVAAAGFDEIQFDYVRFPEAYSSLPAQVHPREAGDRTKAIATFLSAARERLAPYGVPVAADVFGMSMNDAADVGIGQQWERLSTVVDHILPMAYPSHYFSTHLPGIARPNRTPYETIATAVGMAVIRHERIREAGGTPARIIPWLQAFDAPWVDRDFPYRAAQVRAQIEATYDVGLDDWILWDPGVRYERLAEAFEPSAESRARPYEPPLSLVRRMDRYEGWGMAGSRKLALEGENGAPSN